jgi:hypothetical protein
MQIRHCELIKLFFKIRASLCLCSGVCYITVQYTVVKKATFCSILELRFLYSLYSISQELPHTG